LKKIGFWDPIIGKEEISNIKKVLENNYPNEGYLTKKFEKKVESVLKVKHGVAVSSGTASIFLALKSLGVDKDDEIIIPDLTFGATANAVLLIGCKLVLCDVDENLGFDLEKLKKKITKKTKAIIIVHISGRGTNIRQVLAICRKKKIFLIEDAAEAFFSKNNNDYLGTIGDIGCFSLTASKIITTGQGGIIVTNKTKIFEKLLLLKNQGIKGKSDGGNVIHRVAGFNFKFTNVQAAIGLAQLKTIKKRVRILKNNHLMYKKCLKQLNNVSLLKFKKEEVPLWNDCKVKQRDKLFSFLEKKKIICRKYWYPVHYHTPFKKFYDKSLQNTKILSKSLIWFPSSLNLLKKDIIFICKQIFIFYKIYE